MEIEIKVFTFFILLMIKFILLCYTQAINFKNTISQVQKLMVFVLTMSLYGLATLFTELIPKFQVDILDLSLEYSFYPVDSGYPVCPLSAAPGAATGEPVFNEKWFRMVPSVSFFCSASGKDKHSGIVLF